MKRLFIVISALLLLAAGAVVWGVKSGWLYRQAHARVVSELENVTGGRVELGAFDFDWRAWRVHVRELVIHGLEAPGQPPFVRVRRADIGLKLTSLWQRKVDLISLTADNPEITISVDARGRTNIPEPRIKRAGSRKPVEQFLDLALGEYRVQKGVFRYSNRMWPLDAEGRNLDLRLDYDRAGKAYAGSVQAHRLRIAAPLRVPIEMDIEAAVRLTADKVAFPTANIRAGASLIKATGGEILLERSFASARLDGTVSIAELGPVLGLPVQHRGNARIAGLFQWLGGTDWTAAGTARAQNLSYRASGIQVDGVSGRATFRAAHRRLDLLGLRLDALGGQFSGRAAVSADRTFSAGGEVRGFDLTRLAALGLKNPAPWPLVVSGPVKVTGPVLAGEARLRIDSPAEGAPPLQGDIAVSFAPGGRLRFEPSSIQLPSSRINVGGDPADKMELSFTSRNLDDLLPLLKAAGVTLTSLPVRLEQGFAQFDGTVTGGLANPQVAGRWRAGPVLIEGRRAEMASGAVEASAVQLRLTGLHWKETSFDLQGYGTVALTDWRPTGTSALSAKLTLVNAPIEALLSAARLNYPLDGSLDAQIDVQGTVDAPRVAGRVTAAPFEAYNERFDRAEADLRYEGTKVEIANGRLVNQGGMVEFSATAAGGETRAEILTRNSRLANWEIAQRLQPNMDAQFGAKATLTVRTSGAQPQLTSVNGEVKLLGLTLNGRRLGDVSMEARTKGRLLAADFAAQIRDSRVLGTAEWDLGGASYGLGQFTVSNLTFTDLYDLFGDQSKPPTLRGVLNGEVGFSGPILKPETWTGYAKITSLEVEPLTRRFETATKGPLALRNREPILAFIDEKGVNLQSAHLAAEGTDLEASGTVSFRSKTPWNLRLRGSLNLPVLTLFEPDLVAKGTSALDATIRGSLDKPNIVGRMELRKADLNFRGLPNGVENANGVVVFDRTRANIEKLTAQSGGGELSLTGFVDFSSKELVYRLSGAAQRVRVRYPEDVSTTFNANLNWTGTTAQSLLSGTVTVNKMGINPKTDFGSLLESAGRSSSSPGASSAMLRGIQYDLQVQTASDAELQTSLARDIAPQADLRLRGSAARPVLFGRVSVNQGEIQFFGNQYTITRGDISFFNPTKIEPVIDLDLETKVRGITVSMNFSGPVSKLNASYRSDPPLQSTEIIALLTVGRTPGSGITPTLQQSQSLQSMTGNNTLLGQAISAPINSRLQRLFGVSRIKIDPELTSVTNTPQARLTVEQQLSRDLTVTYITNLNRTQQQIVRVQWDFSRDFSVLAVRDENGIFGVDFLWRKRF